MKEITYRFDCFTCKKIIITDIPYTKYVCTCGKEIKAKKIQKREFKKIKTG